MPTPIFRGYFIRAVKTQAVMPMHLIEWDSYKATPNQREEIKAYRDDNTRDLTRVTAEGKKSVIEFKLRPMWLDGKMEFQAWLGAAMEDTQEAHEQRKVQLEFWDDEENTYKTGYFYVPNIEYSILRVTEDSIRYKEITIKFIEY